MIDNKTIVLTGASSGIGLEVLKLLVKGTGNRILAVARHVDNLEGFADNVIPFPCDISTQEGVDRIFAQAEELFGKIDLFYANAGFPYYEEFNYTDWDRVDAMFRTNTVSPIYTYAKYIQHLDGRPGILAYTISAIGELAMPGYAIYSSSKFALNGFQQAIRLEKPDNLQITCLYPVATDTNFFKVANPVEFEKPFPPPAAGPRGPEDGGGHRKGPGPCQPQRPVRPVQGPHGGSAPRAHRVLEAGDRQTGAVQEEAADHGPGGRGGRRGKGPRGGRGAAGEGARGPEGSGGEGRPSPGGAGGEDPWSINCC